MEKLSSCFVHRAREFIIFICCQVHLWFLITIFDSCIHVLYFSVLWLTDWPPHQLLLGHAGRVNCLLYPHHLHQRYEKSHLVSGGVDFAVCLWDLYSGTLIHRFCVHAGEITQLLVPPNSCSVSIAANSLWKDARNLFIKIIKERWPY